MNFLKRIGKNLMNWLYNQDRATVSLLGAPPQETISSEIGRHESNPIDEAAADALDAIQKNHVKNAVTHANALDAADNGMEQ